MAIEAGGRLIVKILVVEDAKDIATLVVTVLRKDGHEVATATSGSQALMASIQGDYDLLICDLMLPDLAGTEIVRALKAQSPRLPVMVMSALDRRDWEQSCLDAGATTYLQKPLSLRQLRSEVELVQKARLCLKIAIIDTDSIHRTRLTKALTALGCDVLAFSGAAAAQEVIEGPHGAGLLVVDTAAPHAVDLVRWAKSQDIPAFAMSEAADAASEDEMMRAGAAFLVSKPVDIDALLTQAAFIVNQGGF